MRLPMALAAVLAVLAALTTGLVLGGAAGYHAGQPAGIWVQHSNWITVYRDDGSHLSMPATTTFSTPAGGHSPHQGQFVAIR
jgi:hypothetical protein